VSFSRLLCYVVVVLSIPRQPTSCLETLIPILRCLSDEELREEVQEKSPAGGLAEGSPQDEGCPPVLFPLPP